MIPISKPIIAPNAKRYLLECLETGWVSSKGPFVKKFEKAFADFVGVKYAVATSSGTAALHLALAAINIGPDDEVIVPALTMISAALPIIYCQAKPVLVEADPLTANIDPAVIEAKITKRTKAIIAVHLNGHPADMKPILNLASQHRLTVIEDAAEAQGAEYQLANKQWTKVGSLGEVGCFSFYGNKIITTGEGGMVTTNISQLATRLRSLRNLARSPHRHFFHQEIAFAYRMNNLEAALGLAQLEEVEKLQERKRTLASIYLTELGSLGGLNLPIEQPYARRIYWNFDLFVNKEAKLNRDELADWLAKHDIETRNFVIPLHQQPAFLKLGLFKGEKYPVAERLSGQGLSLPLGPNIQDKEIYAICRLIKQALQ